MLEPLGSGQPYPCASLRVAGATLAQHQLGLVKALECQKVVWLARGQTADMRALQQSGQLSGLQHHFIASPQQLSALVTATDELVVITEGLFVEPQAVVPLLDGVRPVVLALPDDGAVAEGFERIDINHAAAGVMKIPGALVERLHELPADCDGISALTRIALQSGVPTRVVSATVRATSFWRMIRTEQEALAIEDAWLQERFLDHSRSAGITDRIARGGVRAFGAGLLHHGNASAAASLGVVVFLALALALAVFATSVPALFLCGVAWILTRASGLLRGVERQAHGILAPAIPRVDVLGWLVDLAIVAVVVAGLQPAGASDPASLVERIFAPLMLVLLLRLVPRLLTERPATWIGDRTVLAVILMVAASLGNLGLAVRLLAVGLAFAGLVLPPRRLN